MNTIGQDLISGAGLPYDMKISPSSAPFTKSLPHNPAAGAQATIAAAAAVGVIHVASTVLVSIAAGATAQTPLHWFLRDGPTGTGAILACGVLSAPANSCAWIELTGCSFNSTVGNALTLEFEGVGLSGVFQSVCLSYYDNK